MIISSVKYIDIRFFLFFKERKEKKSWRPHQSSGRGLHGLKPCSGFVIDEKWLSIEK